MTATPEPAAATPLLFNPFDAAFRANPYITYRRLRDEDPVHQSPIGFFVLSRYADCMAMLRDPRASSDGQKSDSFFDEVTRQGLDPDEVIKNSTRPFLFMDPPDHTRLRSLVNKAFTPRVVERLRPRVQEIVDELLDALADGGEMDVIEQLAYPLPVRIISEMLGVPPEDHATFRVWSRELASSLDPDINVSQEALDKRMAASNEFAEYFLKLIAQRQGDDSEDLLSALIRAEHQGDKLTENELLSTCILLLVAGHETTVNLIGNGMLALLRHPDQLSRLRGNPELIESAVEELLRYDSPVQLTARHALADIELSAGTLPKGKTAVLLLGAANRDPAQFDDPEGLDIGRQENRHLAFGMGVHFCLGAPLARVEGQIAIGTLVRRFPEIELVNGAPAYKENITLRGLSALPVRFRAA